MSMPRHSGSYPDISDILARKAEGRKERAALSFAEKLDALDALRKRVEPIIKARQAHRPSSQRGSG